jgi:(1->4)-alpha-D-glucan 1-alpha-D-glucosylmutase
MFVANRALTTRAALRDLYERGDYLPLKAAGARSECLFAFARAPETGPGGSGAAITCVPRLVATLTPDSGTPPLGQAAWGDTFLVVPGCHELRDMFTGAIVRPERTGDDYTLPAASIFSRFPVALLVPADGPNPPAGPDLPDPPDLPAPPALPA